MDLPWCARKVRVQFHVVGGGPICRVVRSEGCRWLYEAGFRHPEIFELDFGDGANIVFRLAGPAPRSYVAEARDFGRPEDTASRPWEWWAGSACQEDADRAAYNAAWLREEVDEGDDGDDVPVGGPLAEAFFAAAPADGGQPGRLRMEGNRTCFRYMTADFKTSDGQALSVSTINGGLPRPGSGWYTADLELPVGVRDVSVRFHEFGGATVSKVVRSEGARWAREGGEYPQEVFTFEHGSKVNAIFRIKGTVFRSFVAQAWDFGRGEDVPQRPWEWWCDDGSQLQRDHAMYTVADPRKAISDRARVRLEITTGNRVIAGLESLVATLRTLSRANVRFCRITLFKQALLGFGSDSGKPLPDVLGAAGVHHEGIVLDVRTGDTVASFLKLDWGRSGITSAMSDTFPDISDLIAYDAKGTFKSRMISDEAGNPSSLVSLLESLTEVDGISEAGFNCIKFAGLVWSTFASQEVSSNLGFAVQPANTCSQTEAEDHSTDRGQATPDISDIDAMLPNFTGDIESRIEAMT